MTSPTSETRTVLPFFELFDTNGIPLDTIFELFHSHSILPDWRDFWKKAEAGNWNPYTTFGKLKEAVAIVYDDDFLKAWEIRMKHCIARRWS